MPDRAARIIGRAAELLDLLEQRAAAVEAVEGQLRPELTDRAQLKPALGRDPAIGLDVFPDLVESASCGPSCVALADELGADGVVGLAQETAVGTRAGDLADALAAEGPGEDQVARHRRAEPAGLACRPATVDVGRPPSR